MNSQMNKLTMNYHLIPLLSITFLFNIALASHQLRFTNNCSFTLWPTLFGTTNNTSSNGSSSSASLPPPVMVSTVFGLASKRTSTVQLADGWFGRITATRERLPMMVTGKNGTGEIDLKNHPLTTVEVKLDSDGGLDFYHLTLEHGFNVPVAFQPLAGTFDSRRLGNALCREVACAVDIARLGHCPPELAVRDMEVVISNGEGGGADLGKVSNGGGIIGCQSACAAFGGDQFCCRGAFDRLERCRSSNWKVDYPSVVFKAHCPMAYSYKYDDSQSTFICQSNANGKIGYGLTFCP